MPFTYVYPKSKQVVEIQRQYMQPQIDADPIFKVFPFRQRDVAELRWNQPDVSYGLQHFRGLEGEEGRVISTGLTETVFEPGYYGEYTQATEKEITQRARVDLTNDSVAIPAGEIVAERDSLLMDRSVARKRYNAWRAAQGNLVLTKPGPNDTISEQVYTYPVRTYVAPVTWDNTTTATPFKNYQTAVQFGVGTSTNFAAGDSWMSSYTANLLLNNANPNDIFGKRDPFGATFNALPGMNGFWRGQNLPSLNTMDDGYDKTKSQLVGNNVVRGVFEKFIPDGIIVIFGKRPGNVPIGEYTLTRNPMRAAYGDGAYGDYRFIKDSSAGINCAVDVPPKLSIHRGHNGGISMFYPESITIMKVLPGV